MAPFRLTPVAGTGYMAPTPPPPPPDPSLRDPSLRDPSLRDPGHITVALSARLSWVLASPRSRTSSMLVLAVRLAATHGRRAQGA